MKSWLKENKRYIYGFLLALLFFVILFLILTTPNDMGYDDRRSGFDLGGEW